MSTTIEKLNKILQTKEAIRTAINNKGVIVTETDTFASYSTAIDNIQNGGGDNPLQYIIDNKDGDGNPSCYSLFSSYKGSSLDNVINKIDTSNVTDMSHMFSNCSNLTTILQLDTSSCTNMSYMFDQCRNLIKVPQLNTSSCTNLRASFINCSALQTIDITHMNITIADYIISFAYGCYSLRKFIVRNMDTIPILDSISFYNCYHFYGTQNDTYNPDGLKDGRIYVPDNKVEELKTATN